MQGNALIAKKQDEHSQDVRLLQQAFADLSKFFVQHLNRSETRIGDLQIAIDQFVQTVEAVVEHVKTGTGATVDARRALEDSKKVLTQSKESLDAAVKNLTGPLPVFNDEAAPKWSHKVLDFVWPQAMRVGKKAIAWWALKLAVGGGTIAALAKLIYSAVNGP